MITGVEEIRVMDAIAGIIGALETEEIKNFIFQYKKLSVNNYRQLFLFYRLLFVKGDKRNS
jgi:hypothetical protein